ncbi:MAG: D-alanine--D-alanine ligase [Candidatus Shapirobacteria bacterium]
MNKKLKVAVLMGGESSEREVSLSSGKTVLHNLDKNKYDVLVVDVPSELNKMLEWKPDVALIILHGKGGEDGVIQGYLETNKIKYSGCGVLSSAIGMDKMIFRKLMESENVLMPKIVNVAPCVVKPLNGGSSIGISIVTQQEDLNKAIIEAKKFDENIIVEELIKGVEVTCGVLGNEALPVVEIIPKNDFFDYESKYMEGMSQEICPARIDDEMTKKVQNLALKVFNIIGGRGYSRIDMIIKDDLIHVLEINTLPGMTPNSLLPREAKATGMSYPQLLDRIIELALE